MEKMASDEENGPDYQDLDNQEEQEPLDDYGPSIFEIQNQPTLEDKWPFLPTAIQTLEENNIPYVIPSHGVASLATFTVILALFVGPAILINFLVDLDPFALYAVKSFLPIAGGIVAPVLCAFKWGNNPVYDYGMTPNRISIQWGVMLLIFFWGLQIARIMFAWSETSEKWKDAYHEDPDHLTEFWLIWGFTAVLYPISYQLSINGYLFTFLTLLHVPRYILFFLITVCAVSVWLVEWEWGFVGGAIWALEAGMLTWTRMKTGGILAGAMGLWGGSLGLFIMGGFFVWLTGY